MAFELTNLPEFAHSLERAAGRLVDQADEAFVKLAEGIAERQRNEAGPRAPFSAAVSIDTHGQRGRKSHVIDVGPPATGSSFVMVFWEFGSIKNPASPWLRPILAEEFAAWEPWS